MNISSNAGRVTNIECIFYRGIGFALLIASLINLYVTFRYFIKRYYHREHHVVSNRLSPIMIGMLISSIVIIFLAIPVAIVQCFTCRDYSSHEILCKLHGFICFTTGLFNMYMIALLSFLRYFSILHKSNWFNKFLENHRNLNTLLCALLSICWSLPPLFEIGSRYVPEGTGFYCSLEWNDPSIQSRIYVLSVIFVNYIIPFFLIIFTNVRVWYTLRCLLKSCYNSYNYRSLPINSCIIKANIISSSYIIDNKILNIELGKVLIDAQLKETTNRLQRLQIDRRYAYMTVMMAAQYFLVWTPYACVSALELIGQTTFIRQYPFLPTFFALFAKLSIILNPIILIYTSKMVHS
ncbi:unnamed protein product [Adineta steineri]|uniref:G-protein coupled receptors family 1 profile domain-containing protein n=1 Tax=Adineta steineri TaxID=433720 RepID=A0A818WNU5_9BILA|nr:unnamed protein product [Adineta steineri]